MKVMQKSMAKVANQVVFIERWSLDTGGLQDVGFTVVTSEVK